MASTRTLRPIGRLIYSGDHVLMNFTQNTSALVAATLITTLVIAATGAVATADENQCNAIFGPVRFSGLISSGDNLPPLTEVEQIDSGLGHGIALLKDGTLAFWGMNNAGQLSPPEGVGDGSQRVTQVSAGFLHNVALLLDGTVACWGANDQGQCDVPEELTEPKPGNPVIQVDAGNNFSAALRLDGSVVSWGDNVGTCDRSDEDESNPIVRIICGPSAIGAFRADGSVFICNFDLEMPEEPLVDLVIFGPSEGNYFFALTEEHEVITWSFDGWHTFNKGPVAQISASDSNFAFLMEDGSVLCGSTNQAEVSPTTFCNTATTDIELGLATRSSIAIGRYHLMVKVEEYDCDNSGVDDLEEITEGLAEDCDGDFVIDSCAVSAGLAPDCNSNLVPDSCDIANGSEDTNENGIPDSCDLARGDFNLDGCIDGADLGIFFGLWGDTNPPYGDFNSDGVINGVDLGRLLIAFGICQ